MNKNKQNKDSFADLARKIQSKYKRLDFDPIEQKEFEAEMEKLQAEQEMVRSAMGLNQQEQPVQQFNNGGEFDPLPFNLNALAPRKLPEDAYLTPEQLSSGYIPHLDNSKGDKLLKDYIGGMPNIYERALYNSYTPSINPTVSSEYSKGLSSTPGNEFLYTNSTIPTKTPVVSTKPIKRSPVIKQSLVNEPIDYSRDEINFEHGDYTPPRINSVNPNVVNLDTNLRNMNTLTPEQIATLEKEGKTKLGMRGFLNNNKQYAPYAISGISNIASNLLLANMAKKNQQKVNPIFATPNKINLEPQAEQFRKDASVSKNIGLRQARDLGTNAGATLANMGAIGSGVDRQLAGSLTDLYGQQEQYNVGAANQFDSRNQEIANRTNMINSQFNQQANQDRLGFISGALGTIPGVMKDIRMDKADKEMRKIMSTYYKNLGGKNYQTMADLFNDPEAFQYYVKALAELKKEKGDK